MNVFHAFTMNSSPAMLPVLLLRALQAILDVFKVQFIIFRLMQPPAITSFTQNIFILCFYKQWIVVKVHANDKWRLFGKKNQEADIKYLKIISLPYGQPDQMTFYIWRVSGATFFCQTRTNWYSNIIFICF